MTDEATGKIVFNASAPPLLKQVDLGLIATTNVITEDMPSPQLGIFAIDVWEKLKKLGGSPQIVQSDDGMPLYLGIANGRGQIIPNTDHALKALVNADQRQLVYANVREWREWRLLAAPIRESSHHTYEQTETVTTELSTLQTFENELSASVEASYSTSSLVAEASVTASLSTSFKESVSKQQSLTVTNEIKITEVHEPDYVYAYWHQYLHFEIEILNKPADPNWMPFNEEQLAAINPGKLNFSTLVLEYNDRCAVNELATGVTAPAA